MYFSRELVDCLSKGAQVLGGGGGGREQRGLKTAEEALAAGQVRLAGLEEIFPVYYTTIRAHPPKQGNGFGLKL